MPDRLHIVKKIHKQLVACQHQRDAHSIRWLDVAYLCTSAAKARQLHCPASIAGCRDTAIWLLRPCRFVEPQGLDPDMVSATRAEAAQYSRCSGYNGVGMLSAEAARLCHSPPEALSYETFWPAVPLHKEHQDSHEADSTSKPCVRMSTMPLTCTLCVAAWQAHLHLFTSQHPVCWSTQSAGFCAL